MKLLCLETTLERGVWGELEKKRRGLNIKEKRQS